MNHLDSSATGSECRVLSICAGVLGLDCGARLAIPSAKLVCAVEVEAHACAVIVQRMQEGSVDDAPLWSNAYTFAGRRWRGSVDLILAGFSCQDISVAGRVAGINGERSGVWWQVLRIIDEVRPEACFIENVANILNAPGSEQCECGQMFRGVTVCRSCGRSLSESAAGLVRESAAQSVLGSLASLGYSSAWTCLTAAAVGAPHKRARWFCLATRLENPGLCRWLRAAARQGGSSQRRPPDPQPRVPGVVQDGPEGSGRRADVADTGRVGDERRRDGGDVPGQAAGPQGAAQERQRLRDAPGDGGSDVDDAAGPRREGRGCEQSGTPRHEGGSEEPGGRCGPLADAELDGGRIGQPWRGQIGRTAAGRPGGSTEHVGHAERGRLDQGQRRGGGAPGQPDDLGPGRYVCRVCRGRESGCSFCVNGIVTDERLDVPELQAAVEHVRPLEQQDGGVHLPAASAAGVLADAQGEHDGLRERQRVGTAAGAGEEPRAEGHGGTLVNADGSGQRAGGIGEREHGDAAPASGPLDDAARDGGSGCDGQGGIGRGVREGGSGVPGERGEALVNAESVRRPGDGDIGCGEGQGIHDGSGAGQGASGVAADAASEGLPLGRGVGGDEAEELPAAERAGAGRYDGLPLFPPGPGEREAWKWIIGRYPELAPAVRGEPPTCRKVVAACKRAIASHDKRVVKHRKATEAKIQAVMRDRGITAASITDADRDYLASVWDIGPETEAAWAAVRRNLRAELSLARLAEQALEAAPQRPLHDLADGHADRSSGSRADELRACGNACIPAQSGLALIILARRLIGESPAL